MSNLYSILAEWYPDGNYNFKVKTVKSDYVYSIMDGDLTDYL